MFTLTWPGATLAVTWPTPRKAVNDRRKASHRLHPYLERSVRVYGEGEGKVAGGRPHHDFPHLSADLFQHPFDAKTLIIFLAVPFSAVGAVWLLYLLGYNMSIAVWVGLIALMGVDAETGVFMLLYLDLAYYAMRDKGKMKTKEHLREAIVEGAVKRLRPKFMTVAVMFMGLVPIMWSTGSRFRCDETYCRAHGGRHLHVVSSWN